MTDSSNELPALMTLTQELAGIEMLETGTLNPFFMLASEQQAFHIPVNFQTPEQHQFTVVKMAAIMQKKAVDHYTFATRIQFKAQAGEQEVMKQQVLILYAEKTDEGYECFANRYNLKLNQELGKPQLVLFDTLEDFDGQFSNLFEAPEVPDDLLDELTKNIDQFLYKQELH